MNKHDEGTKTTKNNEYQAMNKNICTISIAEWTKQWMNTKKRMDNKNELPTRVINKKEKMDE